MKQIITLCGLCLAASLPLGLAACGESEAPPTLTQAKASAPVQAQKTAGSAHDNSEEEKVEPAVEVPDNPIPTVRRNVPINPRTGEPMIWDFEEKEKVEEVDDGIDLEPDGSLVFNGLVLSAELVQEFLKDERLHWLLKHPKERTLEEETAAIEAWASPIQMFNWMMRSQVDPNRRQDLIRWAADSKFSLDLFRSYAFHCIKYSDSYESSPETDLFGWETGLRIAKAQGDEFLREFVTSTLFINEMEYKKRAIPLLVGSSDGTVIEELHDLMGQTNEAAIPAMKAFATCLPSPDDARFRTSGGLDYVSSELLLGARIGATRAHRLTALRLLSKRSLPSIPDAIYEMHADRDKEVAALAKLLFPKE